MILIAVLLAALAAAYTIRALWRARHTGDYGTIFAVLAAGLLIGLVFLAATGRLHWIAAVAAAFVPFLKRLLGLLQYLPLLRKFTRGNGGRTEGAGGAQVRDTATMTPDRACEILGLGARPTREEVIAAHRRLMQQLHPDRGGSTYFAQLLNEARKVLLDDST